MRIYWAKNAKMRSKHDKWNVPLTVQVVSQISPIAVLQLKKEHWPFYYEWEHHTMLNDKTCIWMELSSLHRERQFRCILKLATQKRWAVIFLCAPLMGSPVAPLPFHWAFLRTDTVARHLQEVKSHSNWKKFTNPHRVTQSNLISSLFMSKGVVINNCSCLSLAPGHG